MLCCRYMKKSKSALIFIAVALLGFATAAYFFIVEDYELMPAEVVAMMEAQADFILLDVRRPDEYADMHLRDARLLPVEELSPEALAQIGLGEDMKDEEIVIYCRSGMRSQTAYEEMKSFGYKNLKVVTGGMMLWQAEDLPYTETSEE